MHQFSGSVIKQATYIVRNRFYTSRFFIIIFRYLAWYRYISADINRAM